LVAWGLLTPIEARSGSGTPRTGPPELTISSSKARVAEGQSLVLTGRLDSLAASDLEVALELVGAGPKDFDAGDAVLRFPAGASSASIEFRALVDGETEADETVIVLTDSPDVVLGSKAEVTITDVTVSRPQVLRRIPVPPCDDEADVALSGPEKGIVEGGGAAKLTLVASLPPCKERTLPIVLGGSAEASEISLSAGAFELGAGETSAVVLISAIDDTLDEASETVAVRAMPTAGGGIPEAIEFAVADNDADIVFAALSGPERVVAGRRTQFKMVVSNPGHKQVDEIRISEQPVAGIEGVEWTCFGDGGALCPAQGTGFVDLLASMPAGSAVVVVVDATISPKQRDTLLHQATAKVIDAGLSDPDPSDNTAVASHEVEVVADLALALEVGPWDPKAAKPELRYSMTVRNLGPSDAAGALLESPVGAHLAWIGGDPDCVGTEASVSCGLGALGAGAERRLEMVLAVASPYPAFTVQEAWLEASDPDPNPKNDESALETKLDLFVPTLEEVVAIGSTTRESLTSCSQLFETPGRLALRFSEELVGGGGPGDVDSVESYRLYAPGPDGDFEISDCGTAESAVPESDDIEIPLVAARWNAESSIVELEVKSSTTQALTGVRRLIACESLRDSAENPIDGDGDGNPGDAAVRSFRIDAGNLVRNGHFDCNLDGWSALAPTPEDWTLGADASGSASSASSRIDNSAGWPTVGLGVCVPTLGASQFELRLRHRLSPVKVGSVHDLGAAPIVDAMVEVTCTPYPTVSCTGAALVGEGDRSLRPETTPTTSAWTSFVQGLETPEDTGSLLCTVSAAGEYVPFAFEVDEVRLQAFVRDATQLPGTGIDGRQVSRD
jgi:hypothetical protein